MTAQYDKNEYWRRQIIFVKPETELLTSIPTLDSFISL
jgi:hypothetical protein